MTVNTSTLDSSSSMPALFIAHSNPMNAILALQQPGEAVSFFAEELPLGFISMRSLRIG